MLSFDPLSFPKAAVKVSLRLIGISLNSNQEYSRGLRSAMQASFRHQALCLSASESGRLADNRRMHQAADAAVFYVRTREVLCRNPSPQLTIPPFSPHSRFCLC